MEGRYLLAPFGLYHVDDARIGKKKKKKQMYSEILNA